MHLTTRIHYSFFFSFQVSERKDNDFVLDYDASALSSDRVKPQQRYTTYTPDGEPCECFAAYPFEVCFTGFRVHSVQRVSWRLQAAVF